MQKYINTFKYKFYLLDEVDLLCIHVSEFLCICVPACFKCERSSKERVCICRPLKENVVAAMKESENISIP